MSAHPDPRQPLFRRKARAEPPAIPGQPGGASGIIRIIFLVCACVLAGYAGWVALMTRIDHTIPIQTSPGAGPLVEGREPLRVTIWNIGYAGLGEESDFKADGGRRVLPPSRAAVEKNIAGITGVLGGLDSDVVLMQELAGPGLLTYGIDVVGAVRRSVPGHAEFFSSDVRTRFLPRSWSLRHGMGVFARVELAEQGIHRLPEEPGTILGILRRRFHVIVSDLEVSGQPWTLINVHLSAFDKGADIRKNQLDEAMALARERYGQGRAVVLGGDWNMRLMNTEFSHDSKPEALFWVHDFPGERLPPGWKVVADPSMPTVRTNERPYRPGKNYTTIIDGFVVSPNVEVDGIETLDLGFRFTDHQPVSAAFRRRDS